MPRRVRILSDSSIYHVMIRGNERKNLFLDDEDRTRFIDTLRKLVGHNHNTNEKKFWIYAYCLMDNHVHLLINQGEDEISRIMKRINTSYAYYFNKKYGRVGHLFQDRFKSEAIENEAYLLAVTRYIHNNPVKAGIIEMPGEYKWSSYNEYINKGEKSTQIAQTGVILEMFSYDKEKAIKGFIEYSNTGNNDEFIEYKDMNEGKKLLNQKQTLEYINTFLKNKGLDLYDIKSKINTSIRNELIRELKEKSNLSIRQIADIIGVNRGVVERIKP